MTIEILIWLFPVIFIIHDFEEIIMLKTCQKRNRKYFENKGFKRYPFDYRVSTAAFAIAVMEEFLIISLISLITSLTGNFVIWYGAFFAFSFHVFIHLITAIVIKRYIGSTLTSIIMLPICLFILYQATCYLNFQFAILVATSLICLIIMFVNVLFLQKIMPFFDTCLNNFSSKE